ncbi:hypothetical protein H9P43_006815 [Blastocladiella emersonii ATCC 22665]|nr:hypothetical protein H9P43_006815 [Blastocladiella emersonii ATCC 22665]
MTDTEAENAFLRASQPAWNTKWVHRWLNFAPRSRDTISAFHAEFRVRLRQVTQLVPAVEREFHLKLLFVRRIEDRLAWTAESVRRIVDDARGLISDIVADRITRSYYAPGRVTYTGNQLALKFKFAGTVSCTKSLALAIDFSHAFPLVFESPLSFPLALKSPLSFPFALEGPLSFPFALKGPLSFSLGPLSFPFALKAPPPDADPWVLDQVTYEWAGKFNKTLIPRGTTPEVSHELKWCRGMTKVLLALPQPRRAEVMRGMWSEVAKRVG